MSPVCVIRCDVILNYYFHKKNFITQVALIWLLSRIMELTTKQTFVCYITQIYHDVTFYIFNYGHKITVCSIVLVFTKLIWNISVHLYYFSPMCILRCNFRSKLCEKALSYWLHLYGFSPVCLIRCGLKQPFHKKSFIMLVTFMEAL